MSTIPVTRKIFIQPRKFIDETWARKTHIAYTHPEQFQAWICDVSAEEIQLGLKLNQIGIFMRDISETKSGLPWQKLLTESGNIPMIGGDNIVRYGTNGIKGFIDSENLENFNEKVEPLQQPKVMLQRIIAYITAPKPHIKIMATADQTGDILNVNTVANTVLTTENISPIFVSALLNSELINWYAHKFIFSSAIRSMDLYDYYVGKIPIPILTPEEQQPIVDLAKRIMAAKVENPQANCSVDEKKIDKRVYDLYRLTDAEVQTVKSSIGQHRKN